MARERKRRLPWIVLGLLVIGAAVLLFLSYRAHWAPERELYPTQGVEVDESNGLPHWSALSATGVDFAYLHATYGASRRDSQFAESLASVRHAGIRYGAIHNFSLCQPAEKQAELFITTVPRIDKALSPAVRLAPDDKCPLPASREVVLGRLSTFLSAVESHVGKPAVIYVTPEIEEKYDLSRDLNRRFWLESNYSEPEYGVSDWVLWTANGERHIDSMDTPVRWIVFGKPGKATKEAN